MKKKFFFLQIFFIICFQLNSINHIRWGSAGDPLNGLTITWSNAGVADSIKWGYSTAFEKGCFPGIKRAGYTGNFFKYTFPSLNANSIIYYLLYDSQAKAWIPKRTKTTAPAVNTTNFSFLGVGDSRDGINVWKQIATLADAKRADFTIYNGDIVADGGSAPQWDNWFDNGGTYLQNNLVYHALGNHDAASVPTYLNNFEMPKVNGAGGLYYSFMYGNAVFICLNSEKPADTAQYNWLVNTLKANQDKTWKIVFFHRPFFTIGNHAGEMDAYLNTWWKAFDDYGVDLICNGHDHMYERSKPINRNVSATSPVSSYGSGPGQGRCEIVCGGAGAPLYTGTPTWFVQKYQSKYNFCKFTINGSVLCDTTFDNTGAIIETFCINKTTTGITTDESPRFNQIAIVPNPAESNFTLRYSSPLMGEALIKIYDLEGKEVMSKKINKAQEELQCSYDLSGYAKGIYSVEVIMGDQRDNALLLLK